MIDMRGEPLCIVVAGHRHPGITHLRAAQSVALARGVEDLQRGVLPPLEALVAAVGNLALGPPSAAAASRVRCASPCAPNCPGGCCD